MKVAAGYPGTPSTETMESLAEINKFHGQEIKMEWSTNEMVAFELALGASMCNARSFACMKHVGVNVAADAFMTAVYAGSHGGFVLLSADDPACHSSQNEQDNRYYGLHALCPVFEAINIQEAKDTIRYAFDFSEKFHSIVMMRTTTRLNHARGDLILGDRVDIGNRNYNFDDDSARWTFLPSNARVQRVKLLDRYEAMRKFSNEFPFTKLDLVDGAKMGIISSGVPYSYASDALHNLGLEGKVSMLKLGMVFPFPEELMKRLYQSVERVLVIEELDPFIEDFAKKLAFEVGTRIEIQGKKYFSRKGELDLTSTIAGITKFTNMANPFVGMGISTDGYHKASPRPPVLCPGCSHRSTFYAMKLVEYKSKKKFVYSGDIGCYTLGFYKPTEAIDTCICMGASIGLANGIGKLHDGPVFAIIGDSTFFHSGVSGLIDAVYNQNDIIVMIVDNSVTAMTGFQPHPGTGIKISGEPGTRIPPEQIVLGAGVKKEDLWIVDSNKLAEVTKAIEEAIAKKGPRVIISRHVCALHEAGLTKKKPVPVCIDEDKCTNCMICIKTFGCPALTLSDEGKVTVNEAQCNGCDVCVTICPSEAIKKSS